MSIRPDEYDACRRECDRERFALGEKTVARMDSFSAGALARLDDTIDDEIGLGRSSRTDVDGLIRHFDVESVAVGVGVDGHGGDTHAPRRLDDPAGDLAPVGDQDFLEHAPRLLQPVPAPLGPNEPITTELVLAERAGLLQLHRKPVGDRIGAIAPCLPT